MEQAPGHPLPKTTIIATYVGLIVLTGLMVGLSRIDVSAIPLGWGETFGFSLESSVLHALKGWIVMGIALVMGVITAMFLMGLRYETKLLNLTIFISNFVFLLIFVVFTWADTSFRGEVDPSNEAVTGYQSPVKAAAGAEATEGTGVKPVDAPVMQAPKGLAAPKKAGQGAPAH